MKHSPDPRARSSLIHRLGPLGADSGAIVRRLDEEKEVSIRRALLLALGEFSSKQLPPGGREPLVTKVLGLYRDDPDPGLHGAAEWLLRRWQQDKAVKDVTEKEAENGRHGEERLARIRQELAKGPGGARPQWYVTGQGQTMVLIPGPVEFLMGSPPTEAGREGEPMGKGEQRHRKRISRSFAIAAREVTVGQFLRFRKDHDYDKQGSPTADCPVTRVTWYDAAAYCNWLSKQEGIADPKQWCYEPNAEGGYAAGMKLKPSYLHLEGYRLPSEAEWEFACRAWAVTSRYYGEREDLLGMYAWYMKNSMDQGMLPGVPGRSGVPGDCLKPNDFGLFDILGNALEWCQERPAPYEPGEDREDAGDVVDRTYRVLRGGSLDDQALFVRSAWRHWNVPTNRNSRVGFRLARTFR